MKSLPAEGSSAYLLAFGYGIKRTNIVSSLPRKKCMSRSRLHWIVLFPIAWLYGFLPVYQQFPSFATALDTFDGQ